MKTESIDTLEKFLKLQESLHGRESPQVSKVLARLATAYMRQGDLNRAEGLFKAALSIEQKLDSASSESINELKRALSGLKMRSGEVDEVEKLRVSTDRIPVFNPLAQQLTEPQEGHTATSPAAGASSTETSALTETGAHARNIALEQAIADTKQQVLRLKQVSGQESASVADALTKLADLYCRQEKLSEMEPLLIEALRIREVVCGENHISVTTDLKNLGRLYYFKGNFDLAETLLKRAMKIRSATLGPYHSYVADVAEWYAKVLRRLSRDQEALEMEAMVTESRTKHTSDWDKLKDAGARAASESKLLEAQAFWLAALDECADFRFDDPRLSATLEGLSDIYYRRGKFEKAEPLCKQILQIAETLLGQEHTNVALAANNLAIVCEKQGKFAEAAILYQQALVIGEKFLGAGHPDVINLRENVGRTRKEAHRQMERKLDGNSGRWNKSGWWKAYEDQKRAT